jgi:hypothetical protein
MTAIAASQSLPAQAGSLAPLHSRTGAALLAPTARAPGVASYDAYVVNIAVPAIGFCRCATLSPTHARGATVR